MKYSPSPGCGDEADEKRFPAPGILVRKSFGLAEAPFRVLLVTSKIIWSPGDMRFKRTVGKAGEYNVQPVGVS